MNVERVPPVVVAFQLKLLLMAGIGYCGAELRNSWLSWLGATLRLDFDLWEFSGRRLNQRGDRCVPSVRPNALRRTSNKTIRRASPPNHHQIWSLNMTGRAMTDDRHRCSAVVDSLTGRKCSRHGVAERDGRWYCRQHDSERLDAQQRERRTQAKAREAEQQAIRDAARRLCAALEFPVAHVHFDARTDEQTRHLVVSFADAEQLIARLAGFRK
jgi:hypothetical protein